jgi:hypothetical protein
LFRSNAERLNILAKQKLKYLFASADLIKILDITPSVKTRLSIIREVGSRLIDPKAKGEYLLGLFRFSEEKQIVEEILTSDPEPHHQQFYPYRIVQNAFEPLLKKAPGTKFGALLVLVRLNTTSTHLILAKIQASLKIQIVLAMASGAAYKTELDRAQALNHRNMLHISANSNSTYDRT